MSHEPTDRVFVNGGGGSMLRSTLRRQVWRPSLIRRGPAWSRHARRRRLPDGIVAGSRNATRTAECTSEREAVAMVVARGSRRAPADFLALVREVFEQPCDGTKRLFRALSTTDEKGRFEHMTASAHDIAAALRERLPALGRKKLHKLLYYCQGHHLAAFGEPLFSENILAWDMGPVVGALWREEREGMPPPEPHKLNEAELNTIGYVVSRYGKMNGNDLERLSHTEEPWITGDTHRKAGESDRIELRWIQDHFTRTDSGSDDEELPDEDVVTAWLAETQPPADLPPGRPDTREALLARLIRA